MTKKQIELRLSVIMAPIGVSLHRTGSQFALMRFIDGRVVQLGIGSTLQQLLFSYDNKQRHALQQHAIPQINNAIQSREDTGIVGQLVV